MLKLKIQHLHTIFSNNDEMKSVCDGAILVNYELNLRVTKTPDHSGPKKEKGSYVSQLQAKTRVGPSVAEVSNGSQVRLVILGCKLGRNGKRLQSDSTEGSADTTSSER